MFKYQIEDELYLALLEMRHADAFHHVIADNREHIGSFLSFALNQTLVETRAFVQSSLGKFAAGTDVPCGIWYQGTIVGSIGLHVAPNRSSASIGYWLAKEYQGRGIVTKCCRAVIHYGFDELGLHRIEIRAITSNTKSRAIPERLGFTLEGIVHEDVTYKNGYGDSAIYGLLARDWVK